MYFLFDYRNCSVRHMPFPIFDLQPCMKTSAEKTEQLAKKIQDLLQRNVTPCKYSHGQAFRLQQGFLLSSTQQMVDRLVVQTQDTIKAIAAESCDANNDINYATGLIQDADNSKQVLKNIIIIYECINNLMYVLFKAPSKIT